MQLWGPMFRGCRSSLPAGLRQTNIGYEQFKRLLKTCSFGIEIAAHCECLNCASRNCLTYLLAYFTYLLIWIRISNGYYHHVAREPEEAAAPQKIVFAFTKNLENTIYNDYQFHFRICIVT